MSIFTDYEAQRERAWHNEQDDREMAGYHQEMLGFVASWLGAHYYMEDDAIPRPERETRTIQSIKNRLYKDTDCGAWIEFNDSGTPGITIGSIVEGSDVEPCVQPEYLEWPFTGEQLAQAIENIEFSAAEKWTEINA